MTATQQIKIQQLLEQVLGKEKATEFTERIEDLIEAKIENEARVLVTKDDLQRFSEKADSRFDKVDARLWTTFITLVVMLLGLYATIIFRK